MKTVLVIGAGSRGVRYSQIAAELGEEFRIVAVAEPNDDRRGYMQKQYGIPDEMCHTSWEEFLSRPRFADLAMICTMDRDHIAPALAAIEKGYDLLLEKPMGATPEECLTIARAAEQKGVFVQVCHVLRFTPFFCALKRLIDEGAVGEIIHIQHAEDVGNVHQSHSFVRGNWCNSTESTPMIVQKTCHDMDILQWLVGRECTRVQSFGSLTYFRPENAPEGATERCLDGCPHADTCPYHVERVYFGTKRSFSKSAAGKFEYTEEELRELLKTNAYGRCVFRCDNDAVDHQAVNLEFEGGLTVSFSMCAFNQGGRRIRIMGTKGELIGNASDSFVTLYDFATRESRRIPLSDGTGDDSIDSGHGGGDQGIVRAVLTCLKGDRSSKSLCSIRRTCRNHLIAFAAEESRLSGCVVDMKEYERKLEERL